MVTLYEKVGRRYRPVSDSEAYSGLSNGTWLVVVDSGITTTRRLLEPSYAELLAAASTARQKMLEALERASELRPSKRELTEAEKRGYAAYRREVGEDAFMTFTRDSLVEIVNAGIDALVEAASKQ